MIQIAIYGKGGIGKSTISANLSAALSDLKKQVLQVGCDPKHDSTRLLLGGVEMPTVLDYMRDTPQEKQQLRDIIFEGYRGTACVESGGPKPGIGCAGRGILSSFEVMKRLGLKASSFDIVLYDVLGDVVCGGFAVPLRKEYADAVFLVTSGEYMALYAANNILWGIQNFEDEIHRVAGIIFNRRGLVDEEERVFAFARAVGLPVLASLPRDEVFSQAEKARMTLAEAFPSSATAGIFRKLAMYVDTLEKDRSLLHPANPLDELELENLVLGRQESASRIIFSTVPPYDETNGREPSFLCKENEPSAEISSTIPEKKSAEAPEEVPEPPHSASSSRLPLYGCAFSGATTATFHVTDAATVLHGPRSCAHITGDALACSFLKGGGVNTIIDEEKQIPSLFPTNMEEKDVIFGGVKKLEKRIEKTILSGWQTVFVVSTCPGGIIGDDIKRATSRIETRFPDTRIIPVPVEGVLTGDFSTGLFEGYKRVADLIDPSVKPEKGLFNVIGEKSFSLQGEENFRIVARLLKKLGYEVNCRFLKWTDTQSLHSFKKAEINLVACDDPETQNVAVYLSRRFGLELFELPFPVGFQESSLWLKTLAARLLPGKDILPLLQEQEELYKAGIEKYGPHLSGKRVLIVSHTEEIGWILETIQDMGMEILKVGITFTFFGGGSSGILSSEDFPVEREYTDEKRATDAKALMPDLIISSYAPSAPEDGVHYDTIPFFPHMGFLSGLELAKRWSMLLRLPVVEGWKYDRGVNN